MTVVTRFATAEPTLCCVCQRHAVALGYAPAQNKPIIWTCDDSMCHRLARRVYDMPTEQLDGYERIASKKAMDGAGSYLDEIGEYDLTKLDELQLAEFFRRYDVGREHELRRRILAHEAPF